MFICTNEVWLLNNCDNLVVEKWRVTACMVCIIIVGGVTLHSTHGADNCAANHTPVETISSGQSSNSLISNFFVTDELFNIGSGDGLKPNR